MPHSQLSTRNEWGMRTCPYCGRALHLDRFHRPRIVCDDCRDLPALELFDDRYVLTEPE